LAVLFLDPLRIGSNPCAFPGRSSTHVFFSDTKATSDIFHTKDREKVIGIRHARSVDDADALSLGLSQQFESLESGPY
jgi:hypothetical protein